MKIIYFHQHFSTPQGFTGTRSYEMARRLIDRGHQVTMVCGSGFMSKTGLVEEPQKGLRRGIVKGIDVIEICLPYSNYDSPFRRALTFISFALKSINIAWQADYDLLFATSTPLTAAIPGICMKFLRPGKKFVFEVRDLWPELPRAMGVLTNPIVIFGLWALEQLSYAAMDAGVALSPGIRRGMQKGFGGKKKIAMIPNGCDVALFQPREISKVIDEDFLPKLPASGLRCIFTGAHGIANGLDAVMDAACLLKARKRGDIQLIFIGDGKLKPHLIKRAAMQGLDNCLFFDPISKFKLARLLPKMDVGMMILKNVPAFYYGTSPNKFFDYISCGLPVLNNYPGWLAELIIKHECGMALPPENPAAIAEALICLADTPALLKSMGQNAQRLAKSQFPRDLLAERFVAVLEDVIKDRIEQYSMIPSGIMRIDADNQS